MSTLTFLKITAAPLLFSASLLLSGHTGKEKKAPAVLEISGQVAVPDKEKDIKVYLVEENIVIDSAEVNGMETFKFSLQRDHYYAIRVVQPGYLSRLVSVSTFLPKEIKPATYRFHFDLFQMQATDLNKEQSDLLDFPVALVCYDETKGYFDYNPFYTTHIKNTYEKLKDRN